MGVRRRNENGHLPRLLRRMERETEVLHRTQLAVDTLAEDIACQLIEGRTTGDPLQDFALLACNGFLDPSVIALQYRRLQEEVWSRKGMDARLLIVQEGERITEEDGEVFLRNLYLAETCPECPLDISTNDMLLGIPVRPEYLVFRELLAEGVVRPATRVMDGEFLYVGPVRNEYTPRDTLRRNGQKVLYVPPEATFIPFFHPFDIEELEREHGISQEMIRHLHDTWIALRSKKIRRA